MRYPAGHKQRTRDRVIQAASALFRRRGYAATGVDAVMARANLTAGGFYSHFHSKEDLLAEALDGAFRQSRTDWPEPLMQLRGEQWVRAFVSFYLSQEHRDASGPGCPMPSLAPEVSRCAKAPREVFEKHLRELIATVAQRVDPATCKREQAIAAIASSVGGLMLSRAVDDGEFSEEILRACREAVLHELTSSGRD
jgi:TetR/AcrR family transcriptional repressor of nem operon